MNKGETVSVLPFFSSIWQIWEEKKGYTGRIVETPFFLMPACSCSFTAPEASTGMVAGSSYTPMFFPSTVTQTSEMLEEAEPCVAYLVTTDTLSTWR